MNRSNMGKQIAKAPSSKSIARVTKAKKDYMKMYNPIYRKATKRGGK